jgi:hypothetical protein
MTTAGGNVRRFSKIITHGGSGHFDDFMACSLLILKYPEAVVERVPELAKPIIGESDCIYVDIGGKYQPPIYLDHHQDPSIPSSFALVLQHFYGISIDRHRDLLFYDFKDRFGFKRASETLSLPTVMVPSPIENIVLAMWSRASKVRPGDLLHELMREVAKGLLEIIRKREGVREAVSRSDRAITPNGTVVFLEMKSPSLYVVKEQVPDVIGIVKINARDPRRTDVIRVDDNPHFDPVKLTEGLPVAFKHPTGFMVVLDMPFQEAKEAIRQRLSGMMA